MLSRIEYKIRVTVPQIPMALNKALKWGLGTLFNIYRHVIGKNNVIGVNR